MQDSDLAYVAGIIDGEGCVSLNINRRSDVTSGYVFVLKVSVAMTDKEVPEWLKATFGGSLSTHLPAKTGYRIYYAWMLEAKQAANFLGVILPYLRVKTAQATLALEFQKLKSSGGYRRQSPKPQEAYNAEIRVVEQMRQLNRRGKQRGNEIDLSTLR